jgi:hypothetical protein
VTAESSFSDFRNSRKTIDVGGKPHQTGYSFFACTSQAFAHFKTTGFDQSGQQAASFPEWQKRL